MKDRWLAQCRPELAKLITDLLAGGAVPPFVSLIYTDLRGWAEELATGGTWGEEARSGARLLFEIGARLNHHAFVQRWVGKHEEEAIVVLEELGQGVPNELADGLAMWVTDWELREGADAAAPFNSAFANLAWAHADPRQLFARRGKLLTALARWKPEQVPGLFGNDRFDQAILFSPAQIIEETDRFDREIVSLFERTIATKASANQYSSDGGTGLAAFSSFRLLNERRGGRWNERLTELACQPEFAATEPGVEVLRKHRPAEVFERVTVAVGPYLTCRPRKAFEALYRDARADLGGAGGRMLEAILVFQKFRYQMAEDIIECLLDAPGEDDRPTIRRIFLDYAAGLKPKALADFWEPLVELDPSVFRPEWRSFLGGKSKVLRQHAVRWFQAHAADEIAPLAEQLLASPKVEERMGGGALLSGLATADALGRLAECHAADPSKQVREVLAELLAGHGVAVAAEPVEEVPAIESIDAFEAKLAAKPKSIKPPAAPWLDVGKLPPLFASSGEALSELARTFLFQRQAREKGGGVNKELAPLIGYLDRSRNAAFAHALLDQWFASDMRANTRWALEVAGLVGDDSIIERLTAPIPGWCKANHGKRAEWAVHAIALLGTDEALRTLDALIQRYRNQRKYVGAAAAAALSSLAAMQGVSEDEIAERIVPDFGLDEGGERVFRTKPGDEVTARLRPDLKLVWRIGEGKEVGTVPKNLTAAGETEAKELRKLLKEAVKSQLVRLERAMIEGRRWDLPTWRRRFEEHPLFRCFGETLVWAVHDPEGRMLRSFRRYANGILADAKGEPEEFEGVASVSLPHPLVLDDALLGVWAAHLKRFKVKPPFPQIERPVERLDPLHGNRRELRTVEGTVIGAGDFRGRALGRGWSIGSTQDGGYIYEIFRKYPGLGVEVYLALEGFHAMSGRGEELKLGPALFTRFDPNQRRAYLGVMPGPDDPGVLRFDEVPPVVFSETVGDLKAIAGENL